MAGMLSDGPGFVYWDSVGFAALDGGTPGRRALRALQTLRHLAIVEH